MTRLLKATAALCILPLSAAPAAAQEIGIFHISASSAVNEFGSPTGIGAFGRVFPNDFSSVRVGYYSTKSESTRSGRVCLQYSPPVGCTSNEEAVLSTHLRGVLVSFGVHYSPISILKLEVGLGGSMNQVTGSERTATGRKSDVYMKQSAQFGGLAHATGRLRPIRALPITLEAGVHQHRLSLRACDDENIRYDPYCATVNLREIRFGIGYDFAW